MSIIMLNVFMLIGILLNVIRISIILLNVVAPKFLAAAALFIFFAKEPKKTWKNAGARSFKTFFAFANAENKLECLSADHSDICE